MIKLIRVFDKTLGIDFSGEDGHIQLRELIEEELSGIDIDGIPCSACGKSYPVHGVVYTRQRRLVWDSPGKCVLFYAPTLRYVCEICGASGTATIIPDLVIGKTTLSYHYLFRLIRTRLQPNDMNIYERDNQLYELLSEESLNKWVKRFHADFFILQRLIKLEQNDFLSEKIMYGDIFRQFYLSEGRFFMDDSNVEMIISNENAKDISYVHGIPQNIS